jgi:hypothetical protein
MANFPPQISRVVIYGLGRQAADARVQPGFPLEGQQIVANDDFPGIILETLTGYWEAVLIEYRSRVPGTQRPNQTILYRHQIDEGVRVRQIRLSREPPPPGEELF